MSYLECPDCKKKINIFGESNIEKIAAEYGIETISRLPIRPEIARLSDNGKIEDFNEEYLSEILKIIIK